MQPQTFLKHWNTIRADLYQAMDLLQDHQLGFKPHPNLWSLHEVLCHIASVEEGWFRYIVTHEIKGWGEADFLPVDYPSLTALKDLLARVHTRTEAMFAAEANLETAMLREIHTPWGRTTTLEWVIWHVVEHEIHHRGEVYLMLGMLGVEAPDV